MTPPPRPLFDPFWHTYRSSMHIWYYWLLFFVYKRKTVKKMSLKNNCYLSVYGVFRSEFNIASLTSLLSAGTSSSPFCVGCKMPWRRNTEKVDRCRRWSWSPVHCGPRPKNPAEFDCKEKQMCCFKSEARTDFNSAVLHFKFYIPTVSCRFQKVQFSPETSSGVERFWFFLGVALCHTCVRLLLVSLSLERLRPQNLLLSRIGCNSLLVVDFAICWWAELMYVYQWSSTIFSSLAE